MKLFIATPYLLLGVFVLIIGFIGVFSPILIKRPFDDISKRANATRRLDGYSYSILAAGNGLMFPGNLDLGTIGALRHLISLELIELDAFPSEQPSWGYYLTDLGRYILTEKLHRRLYPSEFCEMIRVRYWKGYPKEFISKKGNFKNKFKISWDEAWNIFDKVIRKTEPNQPQKDAITIFESYQVGKSYDTVMNALVIPWQKEIKQ